MKHIGIVGCSAEGAALCYRTICQEGAKRLGGHDHPEVSMHTHSLGDYVRRLEAGDWDGVAERMLASADALRDAGADFLICPDNTIHGAWTQVRSASPLPWLHIADGVATMAAAKGYRTLGILGTLWLTESDVYPSRLEPKGLGFIRPKPSDRERVSRIIMNELVHGIFAPSSIDAVGRVIENLREAGADAVILGCTELPLIIDAGNSVLPVLDSTRLLARAALDEALRS